MSPLASLGSFVGTMLLGSVGWWLFSNDSGPDDDGGGGDWEVVPVPMAPCSCAASASASASAAKRTARTRCHRVFARSTVPWPADRANTQENPENGEVLV